MNTNRPIIKSGQLWPAMMVILLLWFLCGKSGASLTPYQPTNGICGAAVDGKLELVVARLKENPDSLLERVRGWTPLRWAAHYGRTNVVTFLLSQGADANSADETGSTPLHSAAFSKHTGVVRSLLAHGADVNAVATGGYSVLHSACQNWSNVDVIEVLLDAGADANVKSEQGVTPLQAVAFRDSAALLEVLLDGGADIDQIGYEGDTALHWAIDGDNVDAALLLAQRGADGGIPNSKGTTTLKVARAKVEATQFATNLKWKRVVTRLKDNMLLKHLPPTARDRTSKLGETGSNLHKNS